MAFLTQCEMKNDYINENIDILAESSCIYSEDGDVEQQRG